MSDITQLLDAALENEPDYLPDVDRMLALAQRRERRRRLAAGGSALGVGAGVGALAIVLAATGGPAARTDTAAALPTIDAASTASSVSTAPADTAGPTALPADARLTKDTVAALVEQLAGIRLSDVHVDVLPPVSDINLSAGIRSAQGQYLNVQVTPAGTSSTAAPSCADLDGSAPDGDGYTGACSVTALPSGGYLVVREGRTSNDRYAKTQADLVAADGSAILAEATNQLATNPAAITKPGATLPPVVTHDPPLTSDQLRRLVLGLNSRR